MPSEFDNIPLEVTAYIFDFLCAADRLVASSVCKQWLYVCCSSKLLQDIVIVVDKTDEFLPVFKNAVRPFCSFLFRNMKIDQDCCSYLKGISEQVVCLCFQGCEFQNVITCNMNDFSRLKELRFDNCDLPDLNQENLVISFPSLTNFTFCTSTTMTDSAFLKLCNTMPKLKSLSVAFCQISYNRAACRRFYPSGFQLDSLSNSLFSYFSIEFLIRNTAKTLTSLDLDHTSLNSTVLSSILKTKDLNLQKLSLSTCNDCLSCLEELHCYQKNLISLNLGYMYALNDAILIPICYNLPGLQVLDLQYCHNITDNCLKHIFQLKDLKKLNLSNSMELGNAGFQNSVNEGKCSLEELSMSRCKVTDDFVSCLTNKHKNLTKLDLSYSLITGLSIHSISKSLLDLTHLTVSYCHKIYDFPEDCILSDLKRLKELSFHGCSNVNPNILPTIGFLEMEYLNLSTIVVTNEMVELLGKQNPSIQELVLKDCKLLTDEVVNHVVFYFSRLKYLELFGCKNLTDNVLHILKKVRTLKNLGIVHCSNITHEAIQNLQAHNKKLSIQCNQASE